MSAKRIQPTLPVDDQGRVVLEDFQDPLAIAAESRQAKLDDSRLVMGAVIMTFGGVLILSTFVSAVSDNPIRQIQRLPDWAHTTDALRYFLLARGLAFGAGFTVGAGIMKIGQQVARPVEMQIKMTQKGAQEQEGGPAAVDALGDAAKSLAEAAQAIVRTLSGGSGG